MSVFNVRNEVFNARNEATKIESFAQAMLTELPGESQAELGLMKELEKLQKDPVVLATVQSQLSWDSYKPSSLPNVELVTADNGQKVDSVMITQADFWTSYGERPKYMTAKIDLKSGVANKVGIGNYCFELNPERRVLNNIETLNLSSNRLENIIDQLAPQLQSSEKTTTDQTPILKQIPNNSAYWEQFQKK